MDSAAAGSSCYWRLRLLLRLRLRRLMKRRKLPLSPFGRGRQRQLVASKIAELDIEAPGYQAPRPLVANAPKNGRRPLRRLRAPPRPPGGSQGGQPRLRTPERRLRRAWTLGAASAARLRARFKAENCWLPHLSLGFQAPSLLIQQ